MTTSELRKIRRKIDTLSSEIIILEDERAKITQTLSFTLNSSGDHDKIGSLTAEILSLSKEIDALEDLYQNSLNRLSRNILEENCIYMHYNLNYSWVKIAMKVGGKNTANGLRMMCERYSW